MTGGEREVVKLRLGHGQPTLNVLPVGQEGETLTLVCPFPVLPVEVPVTVTLPGGEDSKPVEAKIRRIGVELMGEASIPRFKLQLELLSTDAEQELEIPITVDEAEESTSAKGIEKVSVEEERVNEQESASTAADDSGQESAQESGDSPMSPSASWAAGDSFGSVVDGYHESAFEEEPPWVGVIGSIDSSEITEPRPQRSRWPVRAAVSLALIVSVFAVGYVMREQIAPLIVPYLGEELTLASLGLDIAPSTAAQSDEGEEPASTAIEDSTENQANLENSPVQEQDGSGVPEIASAAELEDCEEEPEQRSVETEMEGSIQLAGSAPASLADPTVEEGADNKIRVVLPTRWPVTEARSYRLHDPTGIVVDVPGGMAAERARWIDTDHDRVRSVRVLEREDGVRFIIYLNDEFVPRYRVGYSRTGISVDILGPDPRHTQTK